MAGNKRMALGTINTILNTAPLIIQGATRLVKLIKERNDNTDEMETSPDIPEGTRQEIERLNSRIDEGYESDLEQIKLIEELARQNEMLAATMKKTGRQVMIMTVILGVILVLVIVLMYLVVFA